MTPKELVEARSRVRIYSGVDADLVMAEGVVVGYCSGPTLMIRHDDGTQSSWSAGLPREVVEGRPLRREAGSEATPKMTDLHAGRVLSLSGDINEADAAAITAALRALATQLSDAMRVIKDLVDPDDCWFDHHGGCQAHGYLSLEPGEKCPVQEGKELVAAFGEQATG